MCFPSHVLLHLEISQNKVFYFSAWKNGREKTKKNSSCLGASTRTLLQIQCPQWCCHMGFPVWMHLQKNLNPSQWYPTTIREDVLLSRDPWNDMFFCSKKVLRGTKYIKFIKTSIPNSVAPPKKWLEIHLQRAKSIHESHGRWRYDLAREMMGKTNSQVSHHLKSPLDGRAILPSCDFNNPTSLVETRVDRVPGYSSWN